MNAETHSVLERRTIGELAASYHGATEVFRRFHLNFCCHGDVMLSQAAKDHGVDLGAVTAALGALDTAEWDAPSAMETDDLIEHILTRYHEVHRRELTDLVELAVKVEQVHADHSQVPRGLADQLRKVRGALEAHMKKEELILFPAMRQGPRPGFGAPIAQMRHDHADHGEYLQKLELLTDGYVLPADACRSWQSLFGGVAKLVDDLMEHIHLENNILFPRFETEPGDAA